MDETLAATLPADVADRGRRYTDADSIRQWARLIGVAASVGIVYFLSARLSLLLLTKPDGVAVFWPASGVAAGVLIALGPRARLPVAAGAIVATIVANLMGDRTLFGAVVFRPMQRGRSIADSVADRALLRIGFQSRQAKPRAGNAGVRHRRDRGLGNRRDCRVPILSRFEYADSDYLAALVRFRCPWHHHGRTANHSVRFGRTAAAIAARIYGRRRRTRCAGHPEWACHFSAAGILGDCRPGRAAVSNAAVAGGPLPSGLWSGGRLRQCTHNRFDDNIRHRLFSATPACRSPSAF